MDKDTPEKWTGITKTWEGGKRCFEPKRYGKNITLTPCKGIKGHLFIKIIVDIGVTNSQPPNEPTRKDEVKDIETNKGESLNILFVYK